MVAGNRWVVFLVTIGLVTAPAEGQQRSDPNFHPVVERPAFSPGAGPTVCIDESHHNFHTASGRYRVFADLARADGLVVRPLTSGFTPTSLAACTVVVVANALHESNRTQWTLPTPSAFSEAEIASLLAWIASGGSALIAADHMPFPGAADRLGTALGFRFNNGFAYEADQAPTVVFRTADGSLAVHPVTEGRLPSERIDSVVTFTGQAFRVPSGAVSVLTFTRPAYALMPRTAWQFDPSTPRTDVTGWSQGALLAWGEGRVAVFGEAAMFSAQVSGAEARPMGMNAPEAAQNAAFAVNVLRWLAGSLEGI